MTCYEYLILDLSNFKFHCVPLFCEVNQAHSREQRERERERECVCSYPSLTISSHILTRMSACSFREDNLKLIPKKASLVHYDLVFSLVTTLRAD